MKKIIIAPLNWGLGHATRCIPIINALIKNNFTPIIASDGIALQLLQKEFPNVATIKLPSYNITYAKNIKWSLLLQMPKILKAVKEEQQVIEGFISKNNDVVGVISDNRFGVRSTKVPSVYITHQVQVLSGMTTFLTSMIHQKIINTFNECWIPDDENAVFSGRLSFSKKLNIRKKYIGVLSRFTLKKEEKIIDVLVVLSGVEPQRTYLEKKLLLEFKKYKGSVVFVKGVVENHQKISCQNHIKIYNFMLSDVLEKTMNQSKIVVCRSGYSSIMDLAVLQKKVFFIPTKHQNEQEYLAENLADKKVAPFCDEVDFRVEKLDELTNFSGLESTKTGLDASLFRLFERE